MSVCVVCGQPCVPMADYDQSVMKRANRCATWDNKASRRNGVNVSTALTSRCRTQTGG
jgi:hypothetical protein